MFPPVDLSHELTVGYAARLICYKVGRLVARGSIGCSDREDLEQDLKLHLLRRFDQFDPALAHWNTFVVVVVERYILTYLVAHRRRRRLQFASFEECSHTEVESSCNGGARALGESKQGGIICDPAKQLDLILDVRHIVDLLPESTQHLCKRLMHDPPAEVARQIQIPRTTLHGRISMLRKRFRTALENNRKKDPSPRRPSQ